MLIFEYKLQGNDKQFEALEEAIRTTQFIRNKCVRYWKDNRGVSPYDLSQYCAILAKEFDFASKLNSQARQAAAERASAAILRFYKNCKQKKRGKKGYPRFQKDNRSVEYKTTGWKLSEDYRHITFTDGFEAGTFKLVDTRDLSVFSREQIKRVRVVHRADGYYVQFCLDIMRTEELAPCGQTIGLDMGLSSFYTDSEGEKVECPKFLRKAEKQIKKLQRRVSRKQKGSANRKKSRNRLARKHLQVQRQRKDWAMKLARCVVMSHDVIAIEDLQVRNMVRNHHLAKSIMDASWTQFRTFLEYYARVYGRVVIAIPPQFTSQDCSNCGKRVKKSLSERTHRCSCGCVMDRDENSARIILVIGLTLAGWLIIGTDGQSETDAALVA
jgi:putative transposase